MTLDFGCGTGCELRWLNRVWGASLQNLIGYDYKPNLVELGFDLYLDWGKWDKCFITDNPDWLRAENVFFNIYSGSVIRALSGKKEAREYLNTTFKMLRSNGVFFGQTIGKSEVGTIGQNHPRFLSTKTGLHNLLSDAGFTAIEIKSEPMLDGMERFWVYAEINKN